jgi:DNA-binding MarR family transcriptional regulator
MTVQPARRRKDAPEAGARAQLTRPHAQQLLVSLGAIGQRLTDSLAASLGDLDLTGNAPVLVVCDLKLRGPLRPRDLQEVTGLTSGGMTKVLDRLEEAELIRRSFGRVPGDRRAIVVSLTPGGERAADTMADAIIRCCPDLRSQIAALAALLD